MPGAQCKLSERITDTGRPASLPGKPRFPEKLDRRISRSHRLAPCYFARVAPICQLPPWLMYAGCFSACLPISQLLTKTFQPWALVLTFRRSSLRKRPRAKLGGFMAFRARPTVLIAEDKPLIAVSYEDMLTDAGLSVEGLSSHVNRPRNG
jgi:hypothetical protein